MHAHTRTHTHIYTHMWEALKDLLVAALEKAKHFCDNWKQQVDCRGLLMQTYNPVNVCVVNDQQSKFNVVNGQSPAKSAWSTVKTRKELVKVWPAVTAEWHPPEQCAIITVSPIPLKCILITSTLNINAHFDQTFHFLIKHYMCTILTSCFNVCSSACLKSINRRQPSPPP